MRVDGWDAGPAPDQGWASARRLGYHQRPWRSRRGARGPALPRPTGRSPRGDPGRGRRRVPARPRPTSRSPSCSRTSRAPPSCWSASRAAYAEVLATHADLVRDLVAAHGGREVDTQGDAFFVVFPETADAVRCTAAIQSTFAAHPWPDGVTVRLRIGVHAGRAMPTRTGLRGHGRPPRRARRGRGPRRPGAGVGRGRRGPGRRHRRRPRTTPTRCPRCAPWAPSRSRTSGSPWSCSRWRCRGCPATSRRRARSTRPTSRPPPAIRPIPVSPATRRRTRSASSVATALVRVARGAPGAGPLPRGRGRLGVGQVVARAGGPHPRAPRVGAGHRGTGGVARPGSARHRPPDAHGPAPRRARRGARRAAAVRPGRSWSTSSRSCSRCAGTTRPAPPSSSASWACSTRAPGSSSSCAPTSTTGSPPTTACGRSPPTTRPISGPWDPTTCAPPSRDPRATAAGASRRVSSTSSSTTWATSRARCRCCRTPCARPGSAAGARS